MEKRREIKFRMWRDGKMQSVFQLNAYQDHRFDAPLETEEVLMQFTGLHDKNGKEIYEGDIITSIELPKARQVVFKRGAFGLIKASGRNSTPHLTPELIHFNNCEVIGNIYEHSHLLTTPAQSGK